MTERNWADVQATLVTRVPGMRDVNEALLACDNCGTIPADQENENFLKLFMVRTPDRDRPLFLGEVCLNGEVTRYVNGNPAR